MTLVLVGCFLAALVGCSSESDRAADAAIKTKRLVGAWKAVATFDFFYVYSKPGRDGKGTRLAIMEEENGFNVLWPATTYHVVNTYDDGKFVEFDILTDFGPVRHTLEFIGSDDLSAWHTADNRAARNLIKELAGDSAAAAEPAEHKTTFLRVVDPTEAARIDAALDDIDG